jgi:transcriptional regulator with XRE-family HTH domain
MFKGLRAVRKRAGISQAELAERIGTRQSNIAAYESGGKTMSTKIANRVLKALDADDSPGAADLVISNRIRAFQLAKKNGDLGKMLDSASAVIKAGAATPEALPLFEEMVSEVERAIDEEDGYEDDDRDLHGRIKPVVKGSDEDDGRDMYGRVVSSPHGDDDDDGRDLFGRVIRPQNEDADDEDEDDEDLDDGRDVFGRPRIGA